jgi:hypothetical protein
MGHSTRVFADVLERAVADLATRTPATVGTVYRFEQG